MVGAAGARQQFTAMVDGFKLSHRLQCSADGSTFQAVCKKDEGSSLSHIIASAQKFLKVNHEAIDPTQSCKLNTLLDRRIQRLCSRTDRFRRLFLSAEKKEGIATSIKELQALQLLVTRSFGPACRLDRIIAGFRPGNRVGISDKQETFIRVRGRTAASWQKLPEKIVREQKSVFGKVQAFLEKHQETLDLGKLDTLNRHLGERAEGLRRRQYDLFSTFLSSTQSQKIKSSIDALNELSELIQSIKRGTQQSEQSAFFGTGVSFGLGRGPGLGPGKGPGLGEGKGPGLGEGMGPRPGSEPAAAATADFDPEKAHVQPPAQGRPGVCSPLIPETAAAPPPPPEPVPEEVPPLPPPPPALFDFQKKKPKEFKPILPGEPKPPGKKCLTFKQVDIARLSQEELQKQIAILQERIDLLGKLLDELDLLVENYDNKTDALSKAKEDEQAAKKKLATEKSNLTKIKQAIKNDTKISITHVADNTLCIYTPNEAADAIWKEWLGIKSDLAKKGMQPPVYDMSFVDRTPFFGAYNCKVEIQKFKAEIKECEVIIAGLKQEIAAFKKQEINGVTFKNILEIQNFRKLLTDRRKKALDIWKLRLNLRQKQLQGDRVKPKKQSMKKVSDEQFKKAFPQFYAKIRAHQGLPIGQQIKNKTRLQAFRKGSAALHNSK